MRIGFGQLPGELFQKYAANFFEQVRVLEESYGPFVPIIDLITMVELTRDRRRRRYGRGVIH